MNIGIIDSDLLDNGTRFPNLALMKISGYYKANGNNVKLIDDYDDIKKFDKVFLSKVFTKTKIPNNLPNNVTCGGSGLYWDKGPILPKEIEHHMPDYNLYDDYIVKNEYKFKNKQHFKEYKNYSIGFLTKGCIRGCKFCINENSNSVIQHSKLNQFINSSRKNIYLWDDNFLAYKECCGMLEELIKIGKPFNFRQGLDIRCLTKEKAELLNKSKYHGDYIFAFDNIKDKDIIVNKIKLWNSVKTNKKNTKLYIFCGFDYNDIYDENFWINDIIDVLERIYILMQYNCIPYIMRHDNYLNAPNPYRGVYIQLARWCNQPTFFKKQSLLEYVYKTDGIGREDKMYASKRYIEEFTNKHPEIANKYFNLKFSNFTK